MLRLAQNELQSTFMWPQYPLDRCAERAKEPGQPPPLQGPLTEDEYYDRFENVTCIDHVDWCVESEWIRRRFPDELRRKLNV